MARGIKVNSITTLPDGKVEIAYVSGALPLPAGQTGSFTFQSLADVQAEIKAMEAGMTDYNLLLLHLAIVWLQSNGNWANVGAVTNKELQFNTAAANVLKIV